jgi:hypothetical protein
MGMRAAIGVLLLMFASTASAQVVYKCVGKGGAVSFQSAPCPVSARTERTISAVPDSVQSRTVPYVARQPTYSSYTAAPTYAANGYDERAQRKANCQYAKDDREATLDRVGLNRTFDLLRQLDDNVALACKGL